MLLRSRLNRFDGIAKGLKKKEEARKIAEEKQAVASVYGSDIAEKAGSMTNVDKTIAAEDLGKRPESLFSGDTVMNTSGSEKEKKNTKALLGNSRGTLFGN
jgi:hypothetical protein